ncbi:DUF2723 domain-containing protein [Chitinophaga horti]|uniref:DUF2723 domain-containing protein n=1 Tax=Chitinophaga horti TaxID=2920382 RepID=A0ABY6IYP9_9BACT|nr:DUF2723 domain-containing protein [Chitinophaga horti]UYQ92524.1 DUF2723 domain-containing protein [Chitinophaga horti]
MTAKTNPGKASLTYGLIAFAALTLFFILSFPGNRSEADDGFHYAYLVRSSGYAHLFQPRYLFFLPLAKAIWQLFGERIDAYWLMCTLSAICSALTVVLCFRFQERVLKMSRNAALCGCALLLFAYGYWRYSVEAEVYALSNVFCIGVLYLILSQREMRPLVLAVLAGFIAGIGVLIYKPNAIPLFFCFPFAFFLRRYWAAAFVYGIVGVLVVIGGYYITYQALAPQQAFVAFLMDGASQSYGSIFVTGFVLVSNIVSTGFLYGIDSVEQFIRGHFPANMIVEEVYAANTNGVLNFVACATLVLTGIALLWLLIKGFRHTTRKGFKPENWLLVLWIAIYGLVLLYLDPNSPEPWTMLLVPIVLLFTSWLVSPLFEKKLTFVPWLAVSLLALHNLVGGYMLIRSESSDYIVNRAAWLKQHARTGDLVLSLGSGSMLAYIVYESPASICSPEQAFDRCMDEAEKTIAAGHHVYIAEDMIHRDDAVKFRDPETYEKTAVFVEKYKDYLVLVNPENDGFGKIYELKYRGKLN